MSLWWLLKTHPLICFIYKLRKGEYFTSRAAMQQVLYFLVLYFTYTYFTYNKIKLLIIIMSKKETVSIGTFKKWPFHSDFEIRCEDGKVVAALCKYCSEVKYNELIRKAKSRNIKGSALAIIGKRLRISTVLQFRNMLEMQNHFTIGVKKRFYRTKLRL